MFAFDGAGYQLHMFLFAYSLWVKNSHLQPHVGVGNASTEKQTELRGRKEQGREVDRGLRVLTQLAQPIINSSAHQLSHAKKKHQTTTSCTRAHNLCPITDFWFIFYCPAGNTGNIQVTT